jgi:uncharacterized membrane protein YbjE (DUF340 family)
MARHVQARGGRLAQLGAVVILWLAGLGAGFYAILSAGARYGCSRSDKGLACRGSGTALGVGIVVAVVLVVTAGTVLAQDAPSWRARIAYVLVALVVLAGCLLGAHALLNTI